MGICVVLLKLQAGSKRLNVKTLQSLIYKQKANMRVQNASENLGGCMWLDLHKRGENTFRIQIIQFEIQVEVSFIPPPWIIIAKPAIF